MSAIKYIVDENDRVKEIRKVIVHRIRMGDVEDPDLYVAQPLWEWQESEQGKFVMENSLSQPEWHRYNSMFDFGWTYAVMAELDSKKLAEFYLRWGNPNGSDKIQ
jgi:hypothetical protein